MLSKVERYDLFEGYFNFKLFSTNVIFSQLTYLFESIGFKVFESSRLSMRFFSFKIK